MAVVSEEKRRFRALKARLMSSLRRWHEFRAFGSVIEDMFKLAILRIEEIASLYNEIRLQIRCLNAILVALGFREKKVLRKLAELVW